MKKVIVFFAVLSLAFACTKQDNPVVPESFYHKVTITDIMDTTNKFGSAWIIFDDLSRSTPPDRYYFAGKNNINLFFDIYYLNVYYNHYYGNSGNILEFHGFMFDTSNYPNKMTYNNKGMIFETYREGNYGEELLQFRYLYNNKNKISDILDYQYDTVATFHYGANGYLDNYKIVGNNWVKSIRYFIQDNEGYLISTFDVEKDIDGSLDTTNIYEYEYNNEGKLSLIFYESYRGRILTHEYSYDNYGKLRKEIYYFFYFDTDKPDIREYFYDDKGYLIESKSYDSNNIQIHWYKYKYE